MLKIRTTNSLVNIQLEYAGFTDPESRSSQFESAFSLDKNFALAYCRRASFRSSKSICGFIGFEPSFRLSATRSVLISEIFGVVF